MFEISSAYSGAMVHSSPKVEGGEHVEAGQEKPAMTPEALVERAREEAATILENAHTEANELKQKILAEAETEAENKIAARLNGIVSDLGLDLWTARDALATIVEKSIRKMLGGIGDSEALYQAVDQAASDYVEARKISVHANPATADRLRLVNMGRQKAGYSTGLDIVDDPSMEAGRCVLEANGNRIEVSLEAQLAAIRHAVQQGSRPSGTQGQQS